MVTYFLYYMKFIRHLKLNIFRVESNFSDRSIYDKRDDFNFELVNFPFLDGDVPRSSSYSVYISQLIRFAIVCSNMLVTLTIETSFLTLKLLKQSYRFHKLHKAFSKLDLRHSEFIVKYNVVLKTLLQQCK